MSKYIQIFKVNKLVYSILLISMMISIVLASLTLGKVINENNIMNEARRASLKQNFYVNLVHGKHRDYDRLSKLVNDSFKDTYVYTKIPRVEKSVNYAEVIAVGGNLKLGNTPKIYKGEFVSKDNVQKQVVVGKAIKYNGESLNVGDKIRLYSEEFIVVGIVGNKNKISPFDNDIYILHRDIPSKVLDEVLNMGYEVTSNNENCLGQILEFKKGVRNIDKLTEIEYKSFDIPEGNFFASLITNPNVLKIWIFTTINCVIMGYFAVCSRKKEVALLRVYGATNFNIFFKFLKEYLFLGILAGIFAVIVQISLSGVLEVLIGYQIEVSYIAFLCSFLSSLVTVLITTIAPVINCLRIEPIINIKG